MHPVRIFVGSGEASLLERKTLIHTLRSKASQPLDISVFNGTHNSLERNDDPPIPLPVPLHIKYRNVTEFSNYRFYIPELCGFKGKAVFLDSDLVCLGDIVELLDLPMNGSDVLAVPGNYAGTDRWALSVMVMNCETCRLDVEKIYDEIDAGLYTYSDFSGFSSAYLKHHPLKLGRLERKWNSFDEVQADTKIIHYTDLYTQPWKFYEHPVGHIWHEAFHEALSAGAITQAEVDKTIMRGYVRPDILAGNKNPLRRPRRLLKFCLESARGWLHRPSVK